MLEFFAILSKGGIFLWLLQNSHRNPVTYVNKLLFDVFIEERVFVGKYCFDNIQMEYVVNNHLKTIYIAGYYKTFMLPYVKNVLKDVDIAFDGKYSDELLSGVEHIIKGNFDFKNEFSIILLNHEQNDRKKAPTVAFSKNKNANKKSNPEIKKDLLENSETDLVLLDKKNISVVEEAITSTDTNICTKVHEEENLLLFDKNKVEKIEKIELIDENDNLKNGQKKLKDPKELFAQKKSKKQIKSEKTSKKSKTKVARKWDNSFNNDDIETLDFSEKPADHTASNHQPKYSPAAVEETKNLYDAVMKNSSKKQTDKKSKTSGVFSFFSGLVGGKEITKESLEPVMKHMKEHLCGKNVALDIAESICNSVSCQLEKKTLGTFEGLKSVVNNAMKEAIEKILIASHDIDIPSEIAKVNHNQHKPYVIVFCGVNGVGKSTNLAKIAHFLTTKFNHKILIAACDTFRSGAVEQLRTHVTRLNHIISAGKTDAQEYVTLFDKGYNKDASLVAKEAIQNGKKLGKNVVLIDTAGRMQDNEPLMRSLSKLINVNNPDLVLFVGEALVGNDGVDQLKKFSSSLKDYSYGSDPHLIDGVVLTKFDTIDDKVGAAISMVYTTKRPIVFVGTGQTYSDLKRLDVESVVKLLFC